MTTHQFNDQASSLGFQVLFLFLRVVTVVFISLGKEAGRGGGGGGKEGFYHTVVIQKLDQSILIVFYSCQRCPVIILLIMKPFLPHGTRKHLI